MPSLDTKTSKSRAERGFSQRDANRFLWDEIADYFTPYRNRQYQTSDGLNESYRTYDSTAMNSMTAFKNSLVKYITPPNTRFAVIQAGPLYSEQEQSEVNEKLDKLNEVIYAYLGASNFYRVIVDGYEQLAFGTMCLWLKEGSMEDPLRFNSTPISQMGLCSGANRDIDFIARKHKVKAHAFHKAFPTATITPDLQAELNKDENKENEIELLEVQYEDSEDMVWRFEVIHKEDIILAESFECRICFTPRWETTGDNDFGVGVCPQALPDVRTLNKAKEMGLQSAALNIFGIWTIENDAGVNPNNIILEPGVMIPVESNGSQGKAPSIKAMQSGGNFQIQDFIVKELQENIKKTMLDSKLPAQQPQPATALEIAERITQYADDFGAVYARLKDELITPLFKRIISILKRKGILNDDMLPDDMTLDGLLDGLHSKIQVMSPIGKLQEQADLEKDTQAISLLAQMSPQLVALAIKMENLPSYIFRKIGASEELLALTPEEIKVKMAEMAQAMTQQQEATNGEPNDANPS